MTESFVSWHQSVGVRRTHAACGRDLGRWSDFNWKTSCNPACGRCRPRGDQSVARCSPIVTRALMNANSCRLNHCVVDAVKWIIAQYVCCRRSMAAGGFLTSTKKRTSRYQHNVAIPTIASSRCSSFFGRRYAGLYPDLVWFLQRDYYKLHHTCYSPMGQKDGVHAFGYRPNSAESEPIWMKSGAFWAHRWGLAMADFVRGR